LFDFGDYVIGCGGHHGIEVAAKFFYQMRFATSNPMMATAADYVIAEVEQLVELGSSRPTRFTPRAFRRRHLSRQHYEKKIERRTVRKS